jgi:hypothetical protein
MPYEEYLINYNLGYESIHKVMSGQWDDSSAIDVVVCDCVAYTCMDAAHKFGVSLVISTISAEYFSRLNITVA